MRLNMVGKYVVSFSFFILSLIVCLDRFCEAAADNVPATAGDETTLTLSDYLAADIYLSKGERELLNKGYDLYLSSQPEKAVEAFETFLKEFPDSQAKDAAFFWLGKSFSRMKDFEMAGRLFSEIRQMFPGSRLTPHVNTELEMLAKRNVKVETGAVTSEAPKQASVASAKAQRNAESEKKGRKQAGEAATGSVVIGGRKYTTPRILEFMNNAVSATNKLGIKEVYWRTGDINQDFINEQILYEEAERSGFKGSGGAHKEMAARHRLTAEEAGYLKRYIAAADLLESKMTRKPERKIVECLAVSNAGNDNNARALLASELQAQARKGISFKEIYNLHPEAVTFSVTDFSDLPGWIKEWLESLPDGEISVVWNKDGYMIYKPGWDRPSHLFFGDQHNKSREDIKAFVKKYIEELRRKARNVGIINAE